MCSSAHFGHHVELERHGYDIETDDTGDDEIEIFTITNVVHEPSGFRVARVVRNLSHFFTRFFIFLF